MPRPFFRVSAGGVDITSKIAGRGISLSITDGVGLESDTISLEIDDQDGVIAPPRTGVVLNVVGGYEDGAQRDFGDFKVDNVSLSGYPQKIAISAAAVDAKGNPKRKAVKDFQVADFPTYGDIYKHLAGQMGLSLSISGELKGKTNPFEFQSEESELRFATRLGEKIGAAVTVKGNRLVVLKRGAGETAGGQPIPTIVVKPGFNLLSYTVTLKDKPKHSDVKATWFDRKKVERKEVSVSIGSDGPSFLITEPFQNEAEAKNAAAAQAKNLQRGEGSASFEIDGDPSARAEAFVQASGIRSLVDGLWRATTVTHEFSSTAAYKTSIECESPDAEAAASRSSATSP